MLPKYEHEFRDPIHTFIRVSSDERRVIDSRPFQRLRHIHQLALTYLVYPGATHRRFEHCLGVMDLAGRIFDIITRHPRHPEIQHLFPSDKELDYWRTVVRMGALCHDLGHIPFSHGAEAVLPKGTHHEQLSVDVILSAEMREIWSSMKPPLEPKDVAKVAVGLKDWRAIRMSSRRGTNSSPRSSRETPSAQTGPTTCCATRFTRASSMATSIITV